MADVYMKVFFWPSKIVPTTFDTASTVLALSRPVGLLDPAVQLVPCVLSQVTVYHITR